MKTKIKNLTTVLIALVVALLCVFSLGYIKADEIGEHSDVASVRMLSDSAEKIVIASAGGSDFTLLFSSDSLQADQEMAKSLETTIRSLYGIRVRPVADIASKKAEKEILIGNTNRAESAKFYEAVLSTLASENDFAWGYAYVNGKLLFVANNALAYQMGGKEFVEYLTENDFTVSSDLSVFRYKTRAEYDAELEADKEAARQERIDELIATNDSFTQTQFGGAFQNMPTDMYKDPWYYPTAGQHPRLFFTEDKIAEIYDNLLNNPDFEELREKFWAYANAENFTGYFPEATDKNGETYRFNTEILAQLEAKALAYILTGDVLYGYEAIIGAKNAMISVHYTEGLHMDVYHGPSQVMVNVAKVYDWCYDLLTEDDKNQIIAGVSNILGPQMENGMRFPPTGMNGVSGHGTGPQFTRDWVTISLAFYDEAPSWWQFVGGRYFEEYVPVIDYCYQGGYASQGTTTYGDSKYFTKAWAAWLIKNATGEFPYEEEEGFHLGAYYYVSHIQPNGKYFQTGDGGRSNVGCAVGDGMNVFYIAAMLFQDPTLGAWAKYFSKDYTAFTYSFTQENTVCDTLIWVSLAPEVKEEKGESIELIQYLPFPSDTMTARNSWGEDGVAVLMRMGAMTMANHDLRDHGTFQIYYKGLLAGTSGSYKKYGSDVHRYYLQATVAHNGLLIFNPAKSDSAPKFNCSQNHEHSTTTCAISNASRYYYSGSQYARSEAGTIENWLGGNYNMCDLYGVDYSYDMLDGSAEWAYIAGDLTQAYDSDTVKYAGRKMFTIFTDDPTYPMLFFTYDQMTSVDGGENFTKTFLLHTMKEPVIDEEKLTAVVTEGEGRLFLHSVSGAQSITKIGGEGKAYWINGKNCLDLYEDSDNADKIWGRLELSATGNLSDSFLTAMYVSDATNDTPLEIKKLESESVDGVAVMDKFIVFTKTNSDAQQYKEFGFTTTGTGLYNYYIAGLEAGTWNVKVDGTSVAYALSDDGGSIITFSAPAGEVTLTPGNDVIGANGGKIKYNTGGAIIPDSAPLGYNSDMPVELPTTLVRGSDTFLGWYTSPTCEPETKVTHTPTGITGTFTVYAKWLSTLVDADFTDPDFSLNVVEASKGNIVNFNGSGKLDSSFITKTDSNGVQYVEWVEGKNDPLINLSNKNSNYATMTTDDECATFTVSMSRNGDEPMMETQFRIYTKKTADGGSATTRQYIFTTNKEGEVRLGDTGTGPLVTTLTDERVTLKFVMDFKNEEIRAYDELGNPLASLKVAVKPASGAANMSEWRKLLDEIIFYWYGASPETADASMRIYGIRIDEGDRVESARPENAILYHTGGAKLPQDTPTSYSKEAPTKLPIPTKQSFDFGGWYTTPTFDAGTEISEIPVTTEGVINVYASWVRLPDDNEIIYNIAGGKLPDDAPTHFTKGEAMLLPVPAKNGYTFAGWFTSPDYNIDSKISEIPADRATYVEVFAKWVFSTELDFTELDIDASSKDAKVNNVAIRPNGATSFKTVEDENGNKYLELVRGGKGANMILTTGQVAKSSNTSMSYELVAGRKDNEPMSIITFRILAKVDVNGNTLASNNQLYMFMINDSGAYIYDGNNNVTASDETKIADFDADGKITVRFELDFKNEMLIGYKADGTTVTSPLTIPQSSGAQNGLEYQKTFTEYVMYLYTQSGAGDSSRFYSVKIVDDKIFGTEKSEGNIEYEANGGTLPEDAPTKFVSGESTPLPVPTKDGYTFGGWYTAPDFADSTLVTEVPISAAGTFRVYAKWDEIYIPVEGRINYNLDGGTLPEDAPEMFVPGSDTALELPIPTNGDYVFSGWFTEDGTKVTEIPAGTTGEFTVTAKWAKVVIGDDYSESTVEANGKSQTVNDIIYNSNNKADATLITRDENGNRYVEWVNGTADPIIAINNGAIAKMSQHAVSYEIKLARNGSEPFMATAARINLAYDVAGNKLSSSNKIYLYGTKADGTVYLGQDTGAVLGTVPEDGSEFTISVIVDFENLKLLGLCEDGTVISKDITIPSNTGAENGIEYQSCATTYVLYWQGGQANTGASMRVESIKVAEGMLF